MISAAEFLKWLQVFNVQYGSHSITIPVTMAQGGTGAVLSPSNGSLFYSTAMSGALLPTANNGVLVTGNTGLPSISTTLPAGLSIPGFLPLGGGTMTGPIVLSGLPSANLDAACKQYVDGFVPLAGGTMSGALILSGMPVQDNQAATKKYVDDFAAGLPPTGPVNLASTANFPSTYNNGVAGVGATLTATSTGIVNLDGQATVLNGSYLFKDQTAPAQNGIYTCTVAGALGINGVFTRDPHYDTPSAINNSGITPVINGDTQAGQGWYEVNDVTTIGVDPIVFVRFGNSGTVTSITAGTGLTGGTITGTGTIALSIPVVVTSGGTGLMALTAHNLIVGNGVSTPNLLAPSAGLGLPLISQGASADPVYGVALVPGGGTGLATLTAYGLMTAGTTATGVMQQVTIGNSGTILRSGGASALPSFSTATYPATAGTSGNVLTSDGTNWNSSAPAASATSVVVDDTTTNATMYPLWVTAASGSLPVKVSSTKMTFNPSTGIFGLTNAISGLTGFISSAGLTVFNFSYIASAVNYVTCENNITGSSPSLSGNGSDSNVILLLKGKGTGGAAVSGTSTNDNAPTGYVGQYISASVASGSAVSLTSTTTANVTSISLTAGDWDVWGCIGTVPGVGTTTTYLSGSISPTSAVESAADSGYAAVLQFYSGAANTNQTFNLSRCRVSVAGTTTIYLVATSIFAVSTQKVYGLIGARRVR